MKSTSSEFDSHMLEAIYYDYKERTTLSGNDNILIIKQE